MENAKVKKIKCDIFDDFQSMWCTFIRCLEHVEQVTFSKEVTLGIFGEQTNF